MDIVVPIILLLLLLLNGMPIAFALGIAGLIGIWMVTGNVDIAASFLGSVPVEQVTSFTLLALPMFLLLAYFATEGGLADELYDAASAWLSGVRGGLPMSTLLAGGAVGALSGSTLAAASALSSVTVKNQVRMGYSATMSSGVAALSATLAVLIPPSVMMIIYGVQTQTSVGDLLIAGLLPGLLLMVTVAVTVLVWVRVQPSAAPAPKATPWGTRFRLLAKTWPAVLIMVGIFVALYSGLITPTEVAGVGAIATLLVSVVLGKIRWKSMYRASIKATQATSSILMIVIGGTIFARYLAYTGVPQTLASMVVELGLNRWVMIIVIIAAYFVLSMFMDELPLMVLTLPITFPIVMELGFDPVWFGVVTMLMVIMGLIFPPVGIVAFVVSGTSGVPSATVFKGTAILLIPVFVTAALVVAIPEISLWLPSLR